MALDSESHLDDPFPSEAMDSDADNNSSVPISSEDEDSEDPDNCDEIGRECQRIMLEASLTLPTHIARGTIKGVRGTYGATQVNGKPSRMTEWRTRKQNDEAKALRQSRNAAFQVDSTKKSMMTHFFKPSSSFAGGASSPEEGLTGLNAPALDVSDVESVAIESGADDDLLSISSDISGPHSGRSTPTRFNRAPTQEQASAAIPPLLESMRTQKGTGSGHKHTNPDLLTLTRLNQMVALYRLYTTDPELKGKWKKTSETIACSEGKGTRYCRNIRRWCQEFIVDGRLPQNKYGTWTTSVLHTDEDMKMEIIAHLQGIGKYFSAADLHNYINQPAIMERMGRRKPVTTRTARRWLKILEFRWGQEKKGMYSDGHEREDVVRYRQETFLPRYQDLHSQAAQFDHDCGKIPGEEPLPDGQREVIFHYHDESIFYGNDRRKLRWTHDSESCKPYAKGEGQSVMIADFVSATLGWLASPDGTERARVHIRPGKARDGYFSSEEVISQLNTAMDILERFYPQYKHVFIFDNARTHKKSGMCSFGAEHAQKPSSDIRDQLCGQRRPRKANHGPAGTPANRAPENG